MKYFFTLSLFFILLSGLSAQEFTVYPNGLIYSEPTMAQLSHIVDSLNAQFRRCGIDRTYRSLRQARGHYLELNEPPAQARQDMEAGIPLDAFLQKYPKTKIQRDLIVVEDQTTDDGGLSVSVLYAIPYNFGYGPSLRLGPGTGAPAGRYLYDSTWNGGLEAFYLEEELQSIALPETYGRLVQYVDCLADTSGRVYPEEGFVDPLMGEVEAPKEVTRFLKLVRDYPGRPKPPNYPKKDRPERQERFDRELEAYYETFHHWDSLRQNYVNTELAPTASFRTALQAAADAALAEGGYDEELEDYVARYLSPNLALELKRRRQVVGLCSQDSRPRDHAVAIAQLSAQAARWDVFLRAHLDIMNDRFARATDGSYAWAARQTYLRELELLPIETIDLLIGSCLYVDNAAANHYYGDLGRIGRALSETAHPDALESRLLAMIRDEGLDRFNRLRMIYLYRIYTSYLPEDVQAGKTEALRQALDALPAFMRQQIELR